MKLYCTVPVRVAERSRAFTVFARSKAGTVGSNPTQDMDVWCLCVCVFLCLCRGRGLATSWSPVQGVLPTVADQETEETQPYAPKTGANSQVWEQRGRKKILHCISSLSYEYAVRFYSLHAHIFISNTANPSRNCWGNIIGYYFTHFIRLLISQILSYLPFKRTGESHHLYRKRIFLSWWHITGKHRQ
jgi:hypothetical protein